MADSAGRRGGAQLPTGRRAPRGRLGPEGREPPAVGSALGADSRDAVRGPLWARPAAAAAAAVSGSGGASAPGAGVVSAHLRLCGDPGVSARPRPSGPRSRRASPRRDW